MIEFNSLVQLKVLFQKSCTFLIFTKAEASRFKVW